MVHVSFWIGYDGRSFFELSACFAQRGNFCCETGAMEVRIHEQEVGEEVAARARDDGAPWLELD